MQQSCRQCSVSFDISPEDLAFYDKVSPVFNGKKELIPPPTLCPECRFQARLTIRNERHLYKRHCDRTGKEIVSMYPADSPYVAYSNDAWWSDDWDGTEYGTEMDWSKNFLAQFAALSHRVPRVALLNPTSENSPYTNFADGNKNCHLLFNANENEDCHYSAILHSCRSCMDCLWVIASEGCHECTDLDHCYNLRHSRECQNCSDSLFLSECRGCSRCIGCVNLRQKSLHIFNEPVSEEEFEAKRRLLESRENLLRFQEEFEAFRLAHPVPHSHLLQCEQVQGEHLTRCKNMRACSEGLDAEECAYCDIFIHIRHCMDCNSADGAELCLASTSIIGFHDCFTAYCRQSSDCFYCWDCHSCQHCFGCIGLRHRQYCILNKQYTKEEYDELLPKIIEKMRADGEWGEFFPVTMSPFAYNETVAQEYFPMSKEEVLARGWQWREQTDEMPKVDKILPAAQLPDSIDEIPDNILHWAIECDATKRPFKIIKQELEFYRQMRLPVPRLHPDERHRRRMALRNPRKLWKRECQKCGRGIETSYSPERSEIVYCERCYLETVY